MSDNEWCDIRRFNLIMLQKSMIKLSSYHTPSSGSPKNNSTFVQFVMAPSVRESKSFSTSRTSLIVGHFMIWLGPLLLSATQNVMLHTSFVASASIPTILAIGHWFQWQSSLTNMISPTAKFWMLFFHICLACRLWTNSFLNLLQNSLAICFTCRHLLFEYASS